jgi:NAD(P)-dependent dehydrogenase (short-subunit alcohol dehydrogenase family)
MTNKDSNAIFITGSSSGLGLATAKLFASKGWKVIASMRDPNKEKELGNISGVTLMALDVTDPHEIESVAEQVVASGGVDVVFNNAGYGLAGPLEGLTEEQILRMVNTNMLGAIRTTKAFISYFRAKRGGLFINTTSIGGLLAVPFNSIYHATKWALEGWSESMAFELSQFAPAFLLRAYLLRRLNTSGRERPLCFHSPLISELSWVILPSKLLPMRSIAKCRSGSL